MTRSITKLRRKALSDFERAATFANAIPAPDLRSRLRDAFGQTLNRDGKFKDRIDRYCPSSNRKFVPCVIDIAFSAYNVRMAWTNEVHKWDREDKILGITKSTRVHSSGPISGFVRSYIQKPLDDLALDANWFEEGLSEPDSDSDAEPAKPRVDLVRKKAAERELRVVLACLPDDILLAVYANASPALREQVAPLSTLLETRYRSRRFVDQSNVLCKLDQVRGAATQTHSASERFFGPDVLQLIGRLACDPKGLPLPVRTPRLTETSAIQAALLQVTANIEHHAMTRDATRACLKRILDSIPAPPSLKPKAAVASVPRPPKKKARRAPVGGVSAHWWDMHMQPVAAAAGGVPPLPLDAAEEMGDFDE